MNILTFDFLYTLLTGFIAITIFFILLLYCFKGLIKSFKTDKKGKKEGDGN
ncbi:hypothetical protein ACFQ4Z_12100 [Oceanobacillus oncorhynchi subsp. oncorhynchi]|uniref:hypothetical protein n=1 Tax=Oceanobacillus oncorhynchi TaxID=545501 RepID=UPI00363D04E9